MADKGIITRSKAKPPSEEKDPNTMILVNRRSYTGHDHCGPEEEGLSTYRLTSTIMLSLTTNNDSSGTFSLSGSIRRQMNMSLSVSEGHLCNMGRMIEEMESKLRNSLDQVYFGKTKEMVCTLRPPSEVVQMKMPDN